MTQPAPRLVRCRYLRRNDNRCTNQVADDNGEILLCPRHLCRALELYNRIVGSLHQSPTN